MELPTSLSVNQIPQTRFAIIITSIVISFWFRIVGDSIIITYNFLDRFVFLRFASDKSLCTNAASYRLWKNYRVGNKALKTLNTNEIDFLIFVNSFVSISNPKASR